MYITYSMWGCLLSLGNQSLVEDDDWNLLYMAVTRAKRTLFMSTTITDILARAGVSLSIHLCYFAFINTYGSHRLFCRG